MNPSDAILDSLSDYQAWRGQKTDCDLLDYMTCVGTPDLLFAFMELLSPTLIPHDGNYVLANLVNHLPPSQRCHPNQRNQNDLLK